jgi:hypothetical protein
MKGCGRGLAVYHFGISGGTKENTKNVGEDSRSPNRGLNPGPTEYEVEVVTNQLRHSVKRFRKEVVGVCKVWYKIPGSYF